MEQLFVDDCQADDVPRPALRVRTGVQTVWQGAVYSGDQPEPDVHRVLSPQDHTQRTRAACRADVHVNTG